MKATQYIKHLEKLIEVHGDLEVFTLFGHEAKPARPPQFKQLASLKRGERIAKYLNSWDHDRTAIKDVIHI